MLYSEYICLVATRWQQFLQQLQQCRRDRLEFYLDESCDRLKTRRDGYVLMEQKNDNVATVLRQSGGGAKVPSGGGRVCLFKTAASCLYDTWVRD